MSFLKVLFWVLFMVVPSLNKKPEEKGLLSFLFGSCSKCRCGIPNREGRILGGENTHIFEFPWSSIIQHGKDKQVPGTIINNKYVLTAASQIFGINQNDLKVTVGQYDRCLSDISSLNISVERVIVHPDFSERTRANDMALLKLSTPITFGRSVSPICLSTPSTNYLGQVATIFGWSREQNPHEKSNCVPRKLGLPVLNYKTCSLNLKISENTSRPNGCVGVIGSKSPICSDDAGSPVMFRSYEGVYELIGVLTTQNDCKLDSNVAYYSNINDYLSWITTNTRDSCYCLKI